jgi:predicted aminopeptidase
MKKILLGSLSVILAAGAGYLVLTPTGHYLARAAWEEAKILRRRQPIAELVRDSSLALETRDKLRLVLEARTFAEDSVELRTRESFTTFSRLDRDTLILVLSGTRKDELRSRTWWFPIVGRVPYKGFFDFGAARRAERELAAAGYDTFLRPASAFSTLGWFNDPLLPTTLRQDSLDLANTVIHELTHNTFYAAGKAVFNESFANFVGARGAEWFFRTRGESEAAGRVVARWEDEKRLAAFWQRLYERIDTAFKSLPGDENRAARLEIRERIYARARRELVEEVGPRLSTVTPQALQRTRLDNAALTARRLYATDLEVFDMVWAAEGGDLRRAIDTIMELARGAADPFLAMREWLAPRGLPVDSALPAAPTEDVEPLPPEPPPEERP